MYRKLASGLCLVARKKTAMTAIVMKETLKVTNRLESNCSANSSIYALLMRPCLLLLFRNGHVAIAPNPCTETIPKQVMRICDMRKTTQQTLNAATYYLLKNPEHVSQLKRELWEVMRSPKDCPPLHVLENLPFFVGSSVTRLERQIMSISTVVVPISIGLMLPYHGVQW